jgi:excisionase family DNA binding protein
MADVIGFVRFAEHLLTGTQAAKVLRVSQQRVSQLAKSGELKAIRVGRQLMFTRDEVQRYVLARAGLNGSK